MAGLDRRHALLAGLALAMFAATPPAHAQDPRVSEARNAAMAWLALADALNDDATYRTAGLKFRVNLTFAQWKQALPRMRARLGAATRRTLGASAFTRKLRGLPDGEYVRLTFRTGFAGRPNSAETLMMEREGDGVWRVVGYSIR